MSTLEQPNEQQMIDNILAYITPSDLHDERKNGSSLEEILFMHETIHEQMKEQMQEQILAYISSDQLQQIVDMGFSHFHILDMCIARSASRSANVQDFEQEECFTKSAGGAATNRSSVLLPPGATPITQSGALDAKAGEFWFPECRNCACCEGYKYGCKCLNSDVHVCQNSACETTITPVSASVSEEVVVRHSPDIVLKVGQVIAEQVIAEPVTRVRITVENVHELVKGQTIYEGKKHLSRKFISYNLDSGKITIEIPGAPISKNPLVKMYLYI